MSKIISRTEAIKRKLRHYFTGKSCKRGHLSRRLVSTCQCCECALIRLKEWRLANPEEAQERDRRWKNANREKMKANDRRRYAENPEKVREKKRRYYDTHKEDRKAYARKYHEEHRNEINIKARERTKKWVTDNPERAKYNAKVSKHRRRALERNVIGSFTAVDVMNIFKAQSGECAYCSIKLNNKYHVDHIKPLSKGGTNDRRNLQLLCKPCNLSKAARDPIDHMRSLGRLL